MNQYIGVIYGIVSCSKNSFKVINSSYGEVSNVPTRKLGLSALSAIANPMRLKANVNRYPS